MAQVTIRRTIRLDGPIVPEALPGNLFQNEARAHRFEIACTQNGQPVQIEGIVSGRFARANQTTVMIEGSVEDGVAVVELPRDCYNQNGRFAMVIFVSAGGDTTAIYAATGNVAITQNGPIVDDGTIPSIEEIIAQMDAVREATAAADEAAAEARREMANLKWEPGGKNLAYFEWEKTGEDKIKQQISPENEDRFYLAGLYRYEDGEPVCVVLTRDAAPSVSRIHDRMPVMLSGDAAKAWLNPQADARMALDQALNDMTFHEAAKDDEK